MLGFKMRRRYSSNDTKQCYNCHKYFPNDELTIIKVIMSDDKVNDYDYQERLVCDECMDSHYAQCYHTQQHYNRPNFVDLDNNQLYYEKDGDIYCKHCANYYLRKCTNCSEILDTQEDDIHEKDGDFYCQDCFNELFCTCQQCGEVIYLDDAYWTYDSHGYEICVCQNCQDQYIDICENCNETIHLYKDENYVTSDGSRICQSCFQNYYFVCDGCGQVFNIDDSGGSTDYGFYCQQCFLEHGGRKIVHKDEVDPQKQEEKVQYDYGTKIKPKLKKRLVEQETNEFIGVELQLQNDNNDVEETTNFIQQVSKNRKLICKSDGSLDQACGVQINTFPCTYNYHLKSFGWQQVFKVINEYNMTDISGAGLHFHISKNNFTSDQLKALDYFVNNCVSLLGAIGEYTIRKEVGRTR